MEKGGYELEGTEEESWSISCEELRVGTLTKLIKSKKPMRQQATTVGLLKNLNGIMGDLATFASYTANATNNKHPITIIEMRLAPNESWARLTRVRGMRRREKPAAKRSSPKRSRAETFV